AVIAAQLLLGLELHAVVGELGFAALTVLAGAVFAFVDGALRAAPDILAHTAVDLILRLVALGHRVLMFQVLRIAPSFVPDLPEPTGFAAKAQKSLRKLAKPRVAKHRAGRKAREMPVFRGKPGWCQTARAAPNRPSAACKAADGVIPEVKMKRT